MNIKILIVLIAVYFVSFSCTRNSGNDIKIAFEVPDYFPGKLKDRMQYVFDELDKASVMLCGCHIQLVYSELSNLRQREIFDNLDYNSNVYDYSHVIDEDLSLKDYFAHNLRYFSYNSKASEHDDYCTYIMQFVLISTDENGFYIKIYPRDCECEPIETFIIYSKEVPHVLSFG